MSPAETVRPAAVVGRPWILPNLGAEEGLDWRAYPSEPHARIAARLLALLFPETARLAAPRAGGDWQSESTAHHWPDVLGPPPDSAVWPWLDTTPDAFAWLNTRSLAEAAARGLPGQTRVRLAGPATDCVHALHDKAFAIESARVLGLQSAELDRLILVLAPEELARGDESITRLERALDAWPAWTGRRFTLKPRLGSSGRGRVGGAGRVDTPAVRGALPRLARRGGGVFEPWLPRTADLSVTFHLPTADAKPSVLASFELLTTASGLFRGHCGEIDARGRIASGDADDARLRAAAEAVASRAAARGFFGPGGVDAFRYREGDDGREAWRGCVELNARPTMGLVTCGLLHRVRARLPELALPPEGATRGFLFTLLDDGADARREALLARLGAGAHAVELTSRASPGEPRALLFFGPDRTSLREAHRAVVGC